MKKITILFLLSMSLTFVFAQKGQPAPADKNTRVGKLSNGLTYYIRHNNLPANRADFYIAQQVGSVLEEESQRGLAHFLEHMAFNGLENLPGKTMINYLEKIGVKFGENLNASTGFDQTNYLITNVPTTREGIIDTCLLILHDWSSFISLEDAEIDNERGVIREEWRTRNGAGIRTYEAILPIIFQGSQYGNRMPIGTLEVIENFPYQVLRDYYDKWYRPDLQAIIIVGDVDVDAIEAKIKKLFADIKPNENPAQRTQYEVPANEKPIVAIYNDPEDTRVAVTLYQKHDIYPKAERATIEYIKADYAQSLIGIMINTRLQDMVKKADNPFSSAYFYDGMFMVSKTKSAYTISAAPKEGEINQTIEALVLEMKKVTEHGFTASELERAKANLMTYIESQYNERDKQKNSYYVRECINNFQDGEPLVSIEFMYNFIRQTAVVMTLEQINKIASTIKLTDEDLVVVLTGPKKDGLTYPTESEIIATIDAAQEKPVEAYKDDANNDPLIAKMPKSGKVKTIKPIQELGATEWTLSNGATVIIKPTNFKSDEILFHIEGKGGKSLESVQDAVTLEMVPRLASIGGLGNFNKSTLEKKLAGKKAYYNIELSNYTQSISGATNPKDLETLMQLIYLNFTSIRKDNDAFEALMSNLKTEYKNREANPMITFRDSITSVLYNNHPLRKQLKYADIEQINYDKAIEIFKRRFGNARNFVFTFVGNIDEATFKPLVEKYIASLPALKTTETWKDVNVGIAKGNVTRHYERASEVPKSTVGIFYSGNIPATEENMIMMSMLTDILRIVYTEKVREEEGGTYGVGVNGQIASIPTGNYFLQISFDTNPDMKDKLISIIHQQIDEIAANGPRAKDLEKVKENKIKKFNEQIVENRYWDDIISEYMLENINTNKNYQEIVNNTTVESIKNFVDQLLNNKNVKEVVQSSYAK